MTDVYSVLLLDLPVQQAAVIGVFTNTASAHKLVVEAFNYKLDNLSDHPTVAMEDLEITALNPTLLTSFEFPGLDGFFVLVTRNKLES